MKHHSAARELLCCRRPNSADDSLLAIKKAERGIETSSESSVGYARQRDFDRRVTATLESATVPPDFRVEMATAWREILADKHRSRSILMHPVLLVGVFAAVLLIVLVALRMGEDTKSFPGDDFVLGLVEMAIRAHEGVAEVVSGPLSDQGDTLFMRGIERFAVPEQFTEWQVERIKFHSIDNSPVAQLVSNDSVSFFIFEEGDFEVEPDPEGKWYLLESKGWIAAIRKIEGVVFVVVVPGGREKLAKKLQLAE